MKIITKTKELQNLLDSLASSSVSIGLVLTMGNIHAGHLSLIKEAKNNNDFVITSIFVNPTQFNNKSDLKKYPYDLKKDIELIKNISEKIYVFAPKTKEKMLTDCFLKFVF